MKNLTWGLAAALVLPLTACDDDDPAGPEDPLDIVEVAESAGTFTTLVNALESAGLTSTLQGDGPFTVFAPSDAAFATLPAAALNRITSDVDLLTRVLTYHVVPGEFRAADVVGLSSAATVNGKDLPISFDDGEVFVDGVRVVQTDIEAGNGVIHVLEGVLLPEPVLDIIETAAEAGSFTTLLAAVEAAGLTDVLKGEGPFTVLAPTDAAFDMVPAADLAALLADTEALTQVLTYHVISGEAPAETVATLTSAPTLAGLDVAISVESDGTIRVNDATVTTTDIRTTNGIIHVIDAVLLP